MGRVPIGWVTPILRFKIKNKNKYFYTPPPPPPILFFVSSFLPILPWVPDQGQGGSGLHCHSALPTHTREGRRGDWSFQDFILSFRSLQNFILSIRSVRGYTPSLRSFHNKLFHSMVSTGFHPSLPPPWSLQGVPFHSGPSRVRVTLSVHPDSSNQAGGDSIPLHPLAGKGILIFPCHPALLFFFNWSLPLQGLQ